MKTLSSLLLLASCLAGVAADLTVVSFNIRNGGRRMDGVYDHALQHKVLRELSPDLVALQEVDQFTKRSGNVDVVGGFGKALGMTSHFAAALPYMGGSYGSAALSKLPVISDESVHMPVKDGEPRVAVIRLVQLPDGGKLAFVGVHLDSGDNDAARRENARTLLERLKNIKEPVVVTGDFNDQPDTATLAMFAEAGFRRCVPQGDARSFPANDPKIIIDHVFIRDGDQQSIQDVGTKVVNVDHASDHRPLLAKLRLVKKG